MNTIDKFNKLTTERKLYIAQKLADMMQLDPKLIDTKTLHNGLAGLIKHELTMQFFEESLEEYSEVYKKLADS